MQIINSFFNKTQLLKSQTKDIIIETAQVVNKSTSAYCVDISSYGLRTMEQNKNSTIAIFNSDAISYDKNLKLLKKGYN